MVNISKDKVKNKIAKKLEVKKTGRFLKSIRAVKHINGLDGDIRNHKDIKIAVDLLIEGKLPVFTAFGNIFGMIGHPNLKSVQSYNLYKGRPINQTGSVTTVGEHYEDVVDWTRVRHRSLRKESVLKIISELTGKGPVGFILPASLGIPSHLSQVAQDRTRTVQLILPGAVCPSNELFRRAISKIGLNILFATSANISSSVIGAEQPVHFRPEYLRNEFLKYGRDIHIIGDPRGTIQDNYPFHDSRSTSIIKLYDVKRYSDGNPVFDKKGRLILEVVRFGSMNRLVIKQILEAYGFGVEFPHIRNRVAIRNYSRNGKIKRMHSPIRSGA